MIQNRTERTTVQILLTIMLVSGSLTHDCSDYCTQCSSQNGCLNCYKRIGIVGPNGQGNTCSSSLAPETDHCLIYNGGSCRRCSPGWAKDYSSTVNTCIKGTIKNCQFEAILGKRHFCVSCRKGYPSSDKSRCIPARQIKNNIPLCEIGGLDSDTGQPECLQCEKGFTSDRRSCFRTPAALEGCLLSSEGRCATCDYENGYFNTDPYKCSKD